MSTTEESPAAADAASPTAPASAAEAWRRLVAPSPSGRGRRGQYAVAALCALLGFALATQVHATRTQGNGLAAARQDDLVGILAELSDRSDRLHDEIGDLQRTRDRLTSGSGSAAAAVAAARSRTRTLGILAGTVAAHGPGVLVTVHDPDATVGAATLLDAVEELRDAGAEAMEIGGAATPGTGPGHPVVRIVAASYLLDAAGGIRVDGTLLTPPYRFSVIGGPKTLAAALAIPGGVLDTVQRSGGTDASITQRGEVTVRALRRLSPPRYARPASGSSG